MAAPLLQCGASHSTYSPRARQNRGIGADNATWQGREEWELTTAGGVRGECTRDALCFITSIPDSSSSQLYCKDHSPESSGLQKATAVAVHLSGQGTEKSSLLQAEGAHASYPLTLPGQQNRLLLTCTKKMELLCPSSSHHTVTNLEGQSSTHLSIPQPDYRVIMKLASGFQLAAPSSVSTLQSHLPPKVLKMRIWSGNVASAKHNGFSCFSVWRRILMKYWCIIISKYIYSWKSNP